MGFVKIDPKWRCGELNRVPLSMYFTEINSRRKRGVLLERIDRQNSRFRTAETAIIKFGLHASFVELESAKRALNESVTMTGHIYRDVILEQHVRLFRAAMSAEFLFTDDNARPHRANIVDECLQSEDITRMDWPAYSPDLNTIEHVWDMLGRRIAARQLPPTCLPELRRALLDE
ncbi:transposable element Tcb2 transposase [Trichonephila clavipes]|nr:transposable element Tcb2 transposase [Trichonephila clavipes]